MDRNGYVTRMWLVDPPLHSQKPELIRREEARVKTRLLEGKGLGEVLLAWLVYVHRI